MKKLNQAYENLIKNIIKFSDDSALQKVIYLHNFILKTAEYPNVKLIKLMGQKFPIISLFNSEKRNYFSVYGTLVNKKAFCFGLSKTIKTVLSDPRINIKCEIVNGYVKSPTKGQIIHAWNIIYLDDNPYHLDTTFDITRNPNAIKKFNGSKESLNELPSVKASKFCFERLLVSGEKLKDTHLWSENKYPICKGDYSKIEIEAAIKKLKIKGLEFNS